MFKHASATDKSQFLSSSIKYLKLHFNLFLDFGNRKQIYNTLSMGGRQWYLYTCKKRLLLFNYEVKDPTQSNDEMREPHCSITRFAPSKVFLSSIATVIGPTPPGTGVIHPATLHASWKSTSPTNLYPDFLVGSSTALVPTSITAAPGLIQLPLIWKLNRRI